MGQVAGPNLGRAVPKPQIHADRQLLGFHIGRACFFRKLKSLSKTCTVIIATNDMDLLPTCDQIVYLSNGSVVSTGTPEEILPMMQT